MPLRTLLLRKGLPIALAGIVLLMLIELHGAIVRQALHLVGIGQREPTLLAVNDGCGGEFWVPPILRALAAAQSGALQARCPDTPRVLALLPPGQRIGLVFVNDHPLYPTHGSGRAGWFSGAQLRAGFNTLAIAAADTPLLYPYAVRHAAELLPRLHEALRGRMGASSGLDIVDLMPEASRSSIGLHVEAGGTAAPAVAPTATPAASRSLALRRLASGDVDVQAEACVPTGHPLAEPGSRLSGPAFLGTAFQAAVFGPPLAASDPVWRLPLRVEVAACDAGAPGLRLRTQYRIAAGRVVLVWADDFLTLPQDRLQMEGFGDSLQVDFRPADEVEGDRSVWRGRIGPEPTNRAIVSRVLNDPDPAPSSARRTDGSRAPAASGQVAAAGASAPAGSGRRQGLLTALGELRQVLPQTGWATLWALAAAAPVALMLWAVNRARVTLPGDRLLRSRASLIALLAFMGAFAAQPLLLQATATLLGLRQIGEDLSAPVALCAVLLVVPILRGALMPPAGVGHRLAALLAGLCALGLLAGALLVLATTRALVVNPELAGELLNAIPPDMQPFAAAEVARTPGPLALLLLHAAWMVAALTLFWTAVYGLFRVAVPNASVVGAALMAGLLLFALPLSHAVTDLAWVLASLDGMGQGAVGFAVPTPARDDPFNPMAALISAGFVLLVVVIVLRAFRELASAMLDDRQGEVLRRHARTPVLLTVALVIVWPMIDRSWADPQIIHPVAYRLMTFFQAFGALLALMAPWAAAQALDAARRDAPLAERFELPPAMLTLAGAAFAGYLTLWSREPLAVAVLMVTGWLLFRHAILDTGAPTTPVEAGGAGLARRLVDHVAESRLLRTRRSTLDKLFSDGKLSGGALYQQRVELQKLQRRTDQQLGLSQDEAKRRLFQYGPGPTPLRNGLRGALSGLAVALLLQLLVPFKPVGGGIAQGANWLALLAQLIVDPQYRVVVTGLQDSRVLVFLGELLNALSIWTIAGFLFGYVFHRIRGRDGFVRALVFGVGVAVPYLLSQALLAQGEGVPLSSLTRLLPLLVFLLVVGTLVFDGATLRREGVALARLPDIYGLKTSVGYASFAGVLATVQPLIDLVDFLRK